MTVTWRPCSRRILIVEDEALLAENIGAFLAAAGANVVIAHSGEDAIKAADVAESQCVILDYNLPGMDGIQTLLKLRERNPRIHAVMITGQESEAVLAAARAQGIAHILVKPFSLPELKHCVCGAALWTAPSPLAAVHTQTPA